MQLSRATFQACRPGFAPAGRAIVTLAALVAQGCVANESGGTRGEEPMPASIEEVLERQTPSLMRIPGVQGVGQGLCEARACIHVFVLDDATAAGVPNTLEGYPVAPIVSGQFRPRD